MRSHWFKHASIPMGLLVAAGGCDAKINWEERLLEQVAGAEEGAPSINQTPLDPLSITKFAHELPIPRVFAPTVVTSGSRVVRHEYTVGVAKTSVQMLPPGHPETAVLAYFGPVKIPNSPQTEMVTSVPGPVFENTRGIPSLVRWRNEISTPHFMPVDPTLHFANPLAMEAPTAPFLSFPPGYAKAQFPVPHVTHMHGLLVGSEFDGAAEQWFTGSGIVGPTFVTRDYLLPNAQPSAHLFYHDHTMGMTRLGVYAGLVGAAYFIRDPTSPLDQPTSPLPSGEFEIPLVIFDRAFFTDGQLSFPRVSTNPGNAYWQGGDGANTVLVNGKVWPNLNVQRRQYRFRMLAAGNGRNFTVQLDNAGSPVPMTLIGSDGGYLPAPQVVTNFQLGISERADVLVDFSAFAPGTRITMFNLGQNPATLGTVMRFTVLEGASVPALPLPPFPARAVLSVNAPTRIKTLHNTIDADGNATRATDGVDYTAPQTDFPLIGSTEQWDIVNLGGGGHNMHLHLIEFQVLNRQSFDTPAYLQRWQLLNGLRPVTRPIVVDPTPFLIASPTLPLPSETGWKDTFRAASNQVTRIVARWAPQELASGAVTPGQNAFSIDPTTGPGYVWHCHILGHEDNDMMRKLSLVKLWTAGSSYTAGTVVTHLGINYRVRVAHKAQAPQLPPVRFNRYERVNNNDGSWVPQIIYAVGDRVLFEGQLFVALLLHQAQTGQSPMANPELWKPFPMDACGQFQELCHDGTDPSAVQCHDLGHAGPETACLARLQTCLAACSRHGGHAAHASPCSGLCADPVPFTVPDGTEFTSPELGPSEGCYETTSELVTGECRNFMGNKTLTVNGQVMPCDTGTTWPVPLPTQRNHGYCIQTTMGQPHATFTMR